MFSKRVNCSVKHSAVNEVCGTNSILGNISAMEKYPTQSPHPHILLLEGNESAQFWGVPILEAKTRKVLLLNRCGVPMLSSWMPNLPAGATSRREELGLPSRVSHSLSQRPRLSQTLK